VVTNREEQDKYITTSPTEMLSLFEKRSRIDLTLDGTLHQSLNDEQISTSEPAVQDNSPSAIYQLDTAHTSSDLSTYLQNFQKIKQEVLSGAAANPQDYTVIILDTETTGFGRKDDIVQIFAKDIFNRNSKLPNFRQYVWPMVNFSEKAQQVNGITLPMLKDKNALPWRYVGRLFYLWFVSLLVRVVVILAHNANFDRRMVEWNFKRHLPAIQQTGLPRIIWRCSIPIFREILPKGWYIPPKGERIKYNLQVLLNYFQREGTLSNSIQQTHSAEDDVELLYTMLLKGLFKDDLDKLKQYFSTDFDKMQKWSDEYYQFDNFERNPSICKGLFEVARLIQTKQPELLELIVPGLGIWRTEQQQ